MSVGSRADSGACRPAVEGVEAVLQVARDHGPALQRSLGDLPKAGSATWLTCRTHGQDGDGERPQNDAA